MVHVSSVQNGCTIPEVYSILYKETSTVFKENTGHYGTTREVFKFKIYTQKVSTLNLGICITVRTNVPCDTTLPDN